MKVKFKEIGRNKDNWESECEELTYEWLYSQVKRYLMSDNIDFSEDGTVLVGGFRPVGKFEVVEE